MASPEWKPNAVAIAQITKLIPTAFEVGDKVTLTMNGKDIEVTAASTDLATLVSAIVTAWNTSTYPEFAEVTASASDDNEKQRVTVDATSGNFTLTFDAQTTGNIDYDATKEAVQTALEALSNISSGDVAVTGPDGGPWDIEFTGTYATTNVNLLTGDNSGLSGGGASVTITLLQPGGDVVTLTGDTAGKPFTVTSSTTGDGGVSEVQTLTINNTPTGGTFTITVDDGSTTATTSAQPYNETAANIQTDLEALSNVSAGDILVTGSAGGPWTFTFANNFASTNMPALTADASSLTGGDAVVTATVTQTAAASDNAEWTIDFVANPTAGTFTIKVTIGGTTHETSAIAYNASAATVETAIDALPHVGTGNSSVSAAGTVDTNAFTIEFVSDLAETDVSSVDVNTSGLTQSISASSATSQNGGGSLSSNPVAHWRLEEASGTRVDSVGSLDLTDNATVTSNTGKVGTAAQFTSANSEFLNRSSHADIAFGDEDFAISCWVYLDSDATMVIVYKGTGAYNVDVAAEYCVLYNTGVTDFQFRVTTGGNTTTTVSSGTSVSTATWYHIVAYHDSSSNVIGIVVNNGTPVTASHTGGCRNGNGDFDIGYGQATGTYFNGRIDEVGIFNAVPTSDDRNTLYNSGSGTSYPYTGTNEIQTISVAGSPSAGTFIVDYDGQTATFNYNESATTAETKLEALSNIGSGNIQVTGGALPGTALTLEFVGTLAGTNVSQVSIDDDLLRVTITEDAEGTADRNEIVNLSISGQDVFGGTTTLTQSSNTTGNLDWDSTATEVHTALEALAHITASDLTEGGGPWPETDITIEFGGTLAATDVGDITATESFNNGTITIATTTQGSAADAVAVTTFTAATGPNHFDNADNWSTGTVPVDGDNIYFLSGSLGCLYGLQQSGVTPASITIGQSFTGDIGLAPTRGSGTTFYYEYRPQWLQLGNSGDATTTTINIGEGAGAGSRLVNLDSGSGQVVLNVHNTGSPKTGRTSAVWWKGTHASNVANINKGTVDIAYGPADSATVATLKLGFVSNRNGDANVRCGSGVTLTTVDQLGGNLETDSAITTVNLLAGEHIHFGGAVTTANIDGGTLVYRSTGTLTTLTIGNAGGIDFTQDMQSRTVTNCTVNSGSSLVDTFKTVTWTNGIDFNRCSVDDLKKFNIGEHYTLTPSAI